MCQLWDHQLPREDLTMMDFEMLVLVGIGTKKIDEKY